MSNKEDDEIQIEIESDDNAVSQNTKPKIDAEQNELAEFQNKISELNNQLLAANQNVANLEDKLKRSLADFQNLQRKTKTDIEQGINTQVDKFLLKFLTIYDDFIRAKTVLAEQKVNTSGLDSILKNIDSLLKEYNVKPIDVIGEIFDPNLHEAVSIVQDDSLDDGTITKEIRKGYISQNRVIRPSIVEISKQTKIEKNSDE